MNILQSIAANVEAHPNQTAYVLNALDKHESITWSELGSFSDRIGAYIVQTFADHIPVIVYGHKDPLMIASFVACSKSGRAYCPVDISVPEGRLQDIVKEVGPSLIIALEELPAIDCNNARILNKQDLQHIVTSGDATDLSASWVGPNDVYYIIFTSGSTGKPKGV